MFKTLSLLIIWIVIGAPITAHASEGRLAFDQLESGLLSIPNPFRPQLPKKEEPQDIVTPPVIPRPPKDPIKRPESIVKQPPKKRPPRPPVQKIEREKPLPNFTISGVIWNSDRPQAIINDQIVDIGDTISEAKIIDIRKSGIDILFYGKTVTIKHKGASYEP